MVRLRIHAKLKVALGNRLPLALVVVVRQQETQQDGVGFQRIGELPKERCHRREARRGWFRRTCKERARKPS